MSNKRNVASNPYQLLTTNFLSVLGSVGRALQPPPKTSALISWQIDSSTVVDSNYCLSTSSNRTPLLASNYTYSPSSNLNIQTDGTITVDAGTYNISFGCQYNYGPVLAYMIVTNSHGGVTQYNSAATVRMYKDVCVVSSVYWTFTWWNFVVNQGDKINFYIADLYGNSSSIPLYKGTITF